MAERQQVPSTKKATEHRKEKPHKQVPSREDTDLVTLVAGQPQPQLQREHQPPNIISDTKPHTQQKDRSQSEDGPEEQRSAERPSHPPPPPPSTGDDLDIFRQSFIQVGMH